MNRALLQYEMARAGISAEQLAQLLGINRSTFSKKCTGRSEFKLSEIQQIVEILHIEDPAPIFFSAQVS